MNLIDNTYSSCAYSHMGRIPVILKQTATGIKEETSSYFLPTHLNNTKAQGFYKGECVAQFEIGDYRNFVYLITDWVTHQCAILDPQQDLKPILETLKIHNLCLSSILLTHTHFDHIAGVPFLNEIFPNVPVYVHKADSHRLRDNTHVLIKFITNGQIIPLGQLFIQVFHTPGHSAGECCFFIQPDHSPPYLFTGDTLFIRDCGRTDLDSGSTEEMFQSLQEIRKFPPKTIILPGHHYQIECASTLAREMVESPPFQCCSIAELEALP